jgi:hypothetical protein
VSVLASPRVRAERDDVLKAAEAKAQAVLRRVAHERRLAWVQRVHARACYATASTLSYAVNIVAFCSLRVFAETTPRVASMMCAVADAMVLVAGDILLRRASVGARRRHAGAVAGIAACVGVFWALTGSGCSILLAQAAAALVGGAACWTHYRPVLRASRGPDSCAMRVADRSRGQAVRGR